MSAEFCVLYYGVKVPVRSEEELEALETRSDPNVRRARSVGLTAYWGPSSEAGEEEFYLLIGQLLGVFGVEDLSQLVLPGSELRTIMERTEERLKAAGFEGMPSLIVQSQL